jgi:D-alanyl-D-alanine carboxypeptidase (penicillin-binding protein 5/6)
MAHRKPARRRARRIRIRRRRVAAVVVLAAAAGFLAKQFATSASSPPASPTRVDADRLSASVWPAHGQAAFVESGRSQIEAGPNQHAAPIASVAKVMTAYLVLRDHPLRLGEEGPSMTLAESDVVDTERRRAQEESVVPVVAGEELTELEALQALLLPSANNIAAVLARWDAGSVGRFVARMNATARSLGMTHTRYTDPSGYDDATVSTAADQVRIVDRAMRLPVFASIVATPSAALPIAGTVHNTNTLLGRDGFVGVKTGSDDAAGGCFAFRAVRWIDGKRTTITGVVLGQPGDDRIAAGLAAAAAMVDRLADSRTFAADGGAQRRRRAATVAAPTPRANAALAARPSFSAARAAIAPAPPWTPPPGWIDAEAR